ncbi:unnamed protein product [Caenorhabditis bovis]|uniref:SSD domain-containing protein n=1 Tax=Caenorhabditis bovis TaxID=2654633 RepID=A0A8S1EYG7_9PELO|nr:unnamed protein product [Caenorhabditis bovis]
MRFPTFWPYIAFLIGFFTVVVNEIDWFYDVETNGIFETDHRVFEKIYQIHANGDDMRNGVYLTHHRHLLETIADVSVEVHGRPFKLNDVCVKPHFEIINRNGSIPSTESLLFQKFAHEARRISPCLMVTPLNCYFDSLYIHAVIGGWKNADLTHRILRDAYIEAYPNRTRPYIKNATDALAIFDGFLAIMDDLPWIELFRSWRKSLNPQARPRLCADPMGSCENLEGALNYFNMCRTMEQFNDYGERTNTKLVFDGIDSGEISTQLDCDRHRDEFIEWNRKNNAIEIMTGVKIDEPNHVEILNGLCNGIFVPDVNFFARPRNLDGRNSSILRMELAIASPDEIRQRLTDSARISRKSREWSLNQAEDVVLEVRLAIRAAVDAFNATADRQVVSKIAKHDILSKPNLRFRPAANIQGIVDEGGLSSILEFLVVSYAILMAIHFLNCGELSDFVALNFTIFAGILAFFLVFADSNWILTLAIRHLIIFALFVPFNMLLNLWLRDFRAKTRKTGIKRRIERFLASFKPKCCQSPSATGSIRSKRYHRKYAYVIMMALILAGVYFRATIFEVLVPFLVSTMAYYAQRCYHLWCFSKKTDDESSQFCKFLRRFRQWVESPIGRRELPDSDVGEPMMVPNLRRPPPPPYRMGRLTRFRRFLEYSLNFFNILMVLHTKLYLAMFRMKKRKFYICCLIAALLSICTFALLWLPVDYSPTYELLDEKTRDSPNDDVVVNFGDVPKWEVTRTIAANTSLRIVDVGDHSIRCETADAWPNVITVVETTLTKFPAIAISGDLITVYRSIFGAWRSLIKTETSWLGASLAAVGLIAAACFTNTELSPPHLSLVITVAGLATKLEICALVHLLAEPLFGALSNFGLALVLLLTWQPLVALRLFAERRQTTIPILNFANSTCCLTSLVFGAAATWIVSLVAFGTLSRVCALFFTSTVIVYVNFMAAMMLAVAWIEAPEKNVFEVKLDKSSVFRKIDQAADSNGIELCDVQRSQPSPSHCPEIEETELLRREETIEDEIPEILVAPPEYRKPILNEREEQPQPPDDEYEVEVEEEDAHCSEVGDDEDDEDNELGFYCDDEEEDVNSDGEIDEEVMEVMKRIESRWLMKEKPKASEAVDEKEQFLEKVMTSDNEILKLIGSKDTREERKKEYIELLQRHDKLHPPGTISKSQEELELEMVMKALEEDRNAHQGPSTSTQRTVNGEKKASHPLAHQFPKHFTSEMIEFMTNPANRDGIPWTGGIYKPEKIEEPEPERVDCPPELVVVLPGMEEAENPGVEVVIVSESEDEGIGPADEEEEVRDEDDY